MSNVRFRNDHHLASIKTEIELDWRGLGEEFMVRNSEEQASFLLGFEASAHDMGFLGEDLQYSYIADAIPHPHIRKSIADRLRRLADHMAETEEEA